MLRALYSVVVFAFRILKQYYKEKPVIYKTLPSQYSHTVCSCDQCPHRSSVRYCHPSRDVRFLDHVHFTDAQTPS